MHIQQIPETETKKIYIKTYKQLKQLTVSNNVISIKLFRVCPLYSNIQTKQLVPNTIKYGARAMH